MATKRKNTPRSETQYRTLALVLIGIGLLMTLANVIFSIASVTVSDQAVEQVAQNIGTTAGDAGQAIGEAAGEVGRNIGEAAGEAGRTIGQVFGTLGQTVGRTAGSLWPLLLVIVGLGLILRRPTAKVKNDELNHAYSSTDEE